jgi:hypothetical protein
MSVTGSAPPQPRHHNMVGGPYNGGRLECRIQYLFGGAGGTSWSARGGAAEKGVQDSNSSIQLVPMLGYGSFGVA